MAAWREGRRAVQPPRWLFSPDERAQDDAEITADVITAALRHVKIPALTRYLADGGALEYVVTPREQGGGTLWGSNIGFWGLTCRFGDTRV
jgi:S-DNA-T family DNA segregation ATPase FtsK/SpoIIIE